MSYDLIIVSKSSTPELIQMTQNCINSALSDCDLNVILVETSRGDVNYEGVNTIVYLNDQFNYNRALNKGLEVVKGGIHVLCNNDLVFHEGWSKTFEIMQEYDLQSVSVLSNDGRQAGFKRGEYVYEGYQIGSHLTGWCIFVTKDTIRQIGKLDESMNFWYSDNVYADQLRNAGIKHYLYCGAFIEHLTSKTLRTLSFRDQRRYSVQSQRRYRYAG